MKRTASRAPWQIAICATAYATRAILLSLSFIGLLFACSGASFGASGAAFEGGESFLLELFKAVLLALATWAALKVEIATARITAESAKESADEAHRRIDQHLQKGNEP